MLIDLNLCLQAIKSESEYPDQMPDEMWEAIKGDRDAMTQALRLTVRETKDSIKDRLLAIVLESK